jgi:hypothetical protein
LAKNFGLSQGQNAINTRQAHSGRRSAVTTSSFDDANEENDNLDELDQALNLTDNYSGECGLSYIRCLRCNCQLEFYNEEVLSSLIVACSTIIHRECSLAAPFILEMIMSITR